MSNTPSVENARTPSLTTAARYVILICGFLGWLFAGFHLAITSIAMQPAAIALLGQTGEIDVAKYQQLNKEFQNVGSKKLTDSELSDPERLARERLSKDWKSKVARWFAWLQCAFLFGAATGGLLFGWLGDRIGRSKAMAAAILTYSVMAGCASFSNIPEQLLVLWFLACTGVGGMWPNGVALVSEAWASLSRPMTAGIIGTSANIGIFIVSSIAASKTATPDSWRWLFQLGACPVLLGLFVLLLVPESPRWLASRGRQPTDGQAGGSTGEVFRPPLLSITLVGIALATIPLIGGWGSANWMVPWAGDVGAAMTPPNPGLKANVSQARSLAGIVGSFLGGWVGSLLGRRRAYAVISLACLASAQYAFWFVTPLSPNFLLWVGAIGFFSGIYFGWLPLFLPELFPTRVRSTGAGVSFNFGRILTAVTVFLTGTLTSLFDGNYARIGQITSLVFALGVVVICFAPDTSQKQLAD